MVRKKKKWRYVLQVSEELEQKLRERVAFERTDPGDRSTLNSVIERALTEYLVELPK